MYTIFQQFLDGLYHTTILEYVAVFSGIASVWFSKKENILVYPVGLVNTIFYVYLSLRGELFGEASVNLYYTIMSIYGWRLWALRNKQQQPVVQITRSNQRWWLYQLSFFVGLYIVIFFSLSYLKQNFSPGAIPWADAIASSTAFTGMWLMTKKKLESWYWWIATNICSVPLYFVKHFAFTSVYYVILLALAISGLMEWRKKSKANTSLEN